MCLDVYMYVCSLHLLVYVFLCVWMYTCMYAVIYLLVYVFFLLFFFACVSYVNEAHYSMIMNKMWLYVLKCGKNLDMTAMKINVFSGMPVHLYYFSSLDFNCKCMEWVQMTRCKYICVSLCLYVMWRSTGECDWINVCRYIYIFFFLLYFNLFRF